MNPPTAKGSASGANLVLLLPGLKELHEGVALLHQLAVHALGLGEGQDGLEGALRLAGGPQASTGGGQAVVHQALLVFDHFLKDGRLTFHPVGHGGRFDVTEGKRATGRACKKRVGLRVREEFGFVVGEQLIGFAKHTTGG